MASQSANHESAFFGTDIRSFLLLAVLLLTATAAGCAVGKIEGVSVTAYESNLSGALMRTFVGAAADFSPELQVVAVVGGTGVHFQDAVTGKPTGELRFTDAKLMDLPWVEWVRFSPDGELVLASSGQDGPNSIRVFLVGDVNPLYELQWVGEELPMAQWAPLGFFLPDSKRVAVNHGPTVRFYDARSGVHVDFIRTHLNEVNHIAFSNSGDVMAVGSFFDNLIEVYDLTKNTLVDSVRFSLSDAPIGKSPREASEHVNQLIFSPDDTKLLAGVERAGDAGIHGVSDDVWRRTLVYDRRTLSVEKTLMGGSFVAFAPDSRHVALFRNGNQWGRHPKTGETRVIDETSVQILTYPEMREIAVFPASRPLRWVGWVANDALCTVRGEHTGSMWFDPYMNYRGAIIRYEIDLLSAADTMPAPSPVREISSTEIEDTGEE